MKRIILILLLLCCTACTMSKRTAFLVVPETAPAAIDPNTLDSLATAYSEFGGVLLLIDETIEHTGIKENADILNNWGYYRVITSRRVVLDPEVDGISSFTLGFKPDNAYMRVVNPDGTVQTYGKDRLIKQKSETGSDEYVFVYPDIKKAVSYTHLTLPTN